MHTGTDPIRRLRARMPKTNHTATVNAMAELRAEGSVLDLTPPPVSVILARARVQARKEAARLHANLMDMLAESFPPLHV